MEKIEQAKEILKTLGLPKEQQNEMSAMTLLALCGIKEKDNWNKSRRKSLGVSKGIMVFVKKEYGKDYAPNTRETFRRQVLHQFVQARIADYNPDNPKMPVNSPNAHYAITESALDAIRTFNSKSWLSATEKFKSEVGNLSKQYSKERTLNLIPVKLNNGKILKLSAGKHNEVQAAIVEQFAQRFANGGILIYLLKEKESVKIALSLIFNHL
jgi:nitrous oxide reductase